jgi:hypothetical protein
MLPGAPTENAQVSILTVRVTPYGAIRLSLV